MGVFVLGIAVISSAILSGLVTAAAFKSDLFESCFPCLQSGKVKDSEIYGRYYDMNDEQSNYGYSAPVPISTTTKRTSGSPNDKLKQD